MYFSPPALDCLAGHRIVGCKSFFFRLLDLFLQSLLAFHVVKVWYQSNSCYFIGCFTFFRNSEKSFFYPWYLGILQWLYAGWTFFPLSSWLTMFINYPHHSIPHSFSLLHKNVSSKGTQYLTHSRVSITFCWINEFCFPWVWSLVPLLISSGNFFPMSLLIISSPQSSLFFLSGISIKWILDMLSCIFSFRIFSSTCLFVLHIVKVLDFNFHCF